MSNPTEVLDTDPTFTSIDTGTVRFYDVVTEELDRLSVENYDAVMFVVLRDGEFLVDWELNPYRGATPGLALCGALEYAKALVLEEVNREMLRDTLEEGE